MVLRQEKATYGVDTVSRLIYDVEEAPGSVHDFTLCKESLLIVMVLYFSHLKILDTFKRKYGSVIELLICCNGLY